MSLGAQFGSSTLEDAINYAWGKGGVIVAAAEILGCMAAATPILSTLWLPLPPTVPTFILG